MENVNKSIKIMIKNKCNPRNKRIKEKHLQLFNKASVSLVRSCPNVFVSFTQHSRIVI